MSSRPPMSTVEAIAFLKTQPEGTLMRSLDPEGRRSSGIATWALKYCQPFNISPPQVIALHDAMPAQIYDIPEGTLFELSGS